MMSVHLMNKQHKSKRMRFPTFHRHHGLLSSGDIDASIAKECNNSTNDSSELLPLSPLQYIRESEQDNNNDHEDLISTMSTMQQKELDNYNPLQRFEYPLSSNTPLPQDYDDDIINKKKTSIVDEECRTRMLKWCSNVSVSLLDDDTSICLSHFVCSYSSTNDKLNRWSNTLNCIQV